MKQVTLTFREWDTFRQVAKFIYEFTVNKDSVIIKCEAHYLEPLGY
jgi:hypothetical protein